jgi:hypothetical protein
MLLLHGTKLKLPSERLCSWFLHVEVMKKIIIDDIHDRLNPLSPAAQPTNAISFRLYD